MIDVIASTIVILMIIYTCIIPFLVIANDDRRTSTKSLYTGLETLLKKCKTEDAQEVLPQLERFYEKYIQVNPSAKKYYPSFMFWLDSVMLQINLKRKVAGKISQYQDILNKVIEKYEMDNPFNKCTDYQQNLLRDMEELLNNDNKIALSNVIHRTEEEFIRLATEIKKSDRQNRLSIFIGICGIIVSIILAVVKF